MVRDGLFLLDRRFIRKFPEIGRNSAGCNHFVFGVKTLIVLRECLSHALADRHLVHHGSRPDLPVGLALVILTERDFLEAGKFFPVPGEVDAAPSADELFARIEAAPFFLDNFIAAGNHDTVFLADVIRVFVCAAEIRALANNHLGRVAAVLDAVHFVTDKRVELLHLAQVHKEYQLLVADLISRAANKVALNKIKVQVNAGAHNLVTYAESVLFRLSFLRT